MITRFFKHIHYWGENYLILPLMVAFLVGTVLLFNVLTGREPLEDVGAIVGWQINALGICIVVSLTGLTQRFLVGYTARLNNPPQFRNLCLDAAITCFLLSLFSVLIFGLIR